jgi:hypothetical protein
MYCLDYLDTWAKQHGPEMNLHVYTTDVLSAALAFVCTMGTFADPGHVNNKWA